MSQLAHPGALAVTEVAARLAEAMQHDANRVRPDDLSLLEAGVIGWQRGLGHRQITDKHLLALRQGLGTSAALSYEPRKKPQGVDS